MRIRPIHAALFAALACAAPAAAQTTPAPAQVAIAPSHMAAAKRLMEVTNSRKLMMQAAESGFMIPIRQDPRLAGQAEMMRDVFMEAGPWDEMLEATTRLYAETFSEADLLAAVAFYESEVGRRFTERTPALMERSGQVGQEVMQRRMPELMRRMQERMQATGKKGETE